MPHKKKRNRKPTSPGTRFGRLVILGQGPVLLTCNGTARRYWCECDCGKTKLIISSSLRAGRTKSCGCLHHEQAAARQFKHGHTAGGEWTAEYRTWKGMVARCAKPNANGFLRYGGRGIKVCKRWMSFPNFVKDMGLKPTSQHSIERRNNNGDYRPSNCYWAVKSEQDRNKSSNRLLTFNGKTKALVDWAGETGIQAGTIGMRLKRGWTLKSALTRPAIVGAKYFSK
jgi:hypothetical protein